MHRRARRLFGLSLASVLMLLTIGLPRLHAQDAATKEYQVKAVFLFNFIQFTSWPDAAFSSPDAPIRIGVLGENPFGGVLRAAIAGEKIGSREVTVEQLTRLEDARSCQVVFVSKSETGRMAAIIAALANRPVLTVGDMPDFARRGGMINFYLEGPKVRFEINRSAAMDGGFKLSSRVLSLAKLVGSAPAPKGN